MKYIIFDKRFPVIFHEVIVHADIKAGSYPGEPTSAGFVSLTQINRDNSSLESSSKINATVHGESVSLDLKNNGDEDNKLIEKMINGEQF